MAAYYNEIDPYAAQWLRNMIAAGHIAPGDVDTRSIIEVSADDLRGYDQCHFFAGIGGWSYALRLAGWHDDRPVWTGSCPCQPFSQAGAQRGSDDARHLWPTWFRLIRECRPATVFGEQVSGASGLAWLDHVCADLENESYTVGAADLCAAGVGAPHIRQRLWFVGSMEYAAREQVGFSGLTWKPRGTVADRHSTGSLFGQSHGEQDESEQQAPRRTDADRRGEICGLADTDGWNAGSEWQQCGRQHGQQQKDGGTLRVGDCNDERLEGR